MKTTIHIEEVTWKIDLDGHVLHHRKNQDGTVTIYGDGIFKKTIPEIAAKVPSFFNILTDPDDDGPLMAIVDPKRVSLTVNLGEGSFGFELSNPCPDDCAVCEGRDECDQCRLGEEVAADE